MPKQMCYKDEVKPTIFGLILELIFTKLDTAAYREWTTKLEAYKCAKTNKKSALQFETKYNGRVVKTEMTAHDNYNSKTIFEYYAVIEYKNEKNIVVKFTTPQLNGNPEYLSTKEVTVYNYGSVNYATDFGYINKPKEDFSLL